MKRIEESEFVKGWKLFMRIGVGEIVLCLFDEYVGLDVLEFDDWKEVNLGE